MSITLIIIAITAAVSMYAFSNYEIFNKFKFNSPAVVRNNQYYRLITHSFIHSDYTHLFVNGFVLYSFGNALEYYYSHYFGEIATTMFLATYFGGVIISSLSGLQPKRVAENYSAVGASGGVSAVLFATILINPMNKIYFFAVLPIPGIVFGILYLIYSYYMIKKGQDNVAHDAHFIGAVFGFAFPFVMKIELLQEFFAKILNGII